MEIILSFLSVVLIVAWAICFMGYHAEPTVHLLLVAAMLPLMLQGMLRKYSAR